MALEQNLEALKYPYEEIKKETTENLKALKDSIESQNQEYEINPTQDWVEFKHGENIIYITVDEKLNRIFSHKTKKVILYSDLDLLEIEKSWDKNLDRLQQVLEEHWFNKMTPEEIAVTSVFMQEVEKKKVQELENLQKQNLLK